MKKIAAFTLLEILIGMIISSIVIGFCYTGYSVIYKQYLNYNAIKRQNTTAMQLNSVLNNDFVNAEFVRFELDKLIVNSNSNKELYYRFNENYILRRDKGLIDTFMLAALNITPEYFTENEQLQDRLLNSFSFDVSVLGETEHFHFVKEYSSETLIKLQME